jgi:hypothetical protein
MAACEASSGEWGSQDRGWAGLGLYKISITLGLGAKLKRRGCDANDRRDVWRGDVLCMCIEQRNITERTTRFKD